VCHGPRADRADLKQFNERSVGSLNRTQYPSDVIALVVLWRLCYKLALRDLPEMFAIRGIVFIYENGTSMGEQVDACSRRGSPPASAWQGRPKLVRR
jgi:transposase-like protein